MKSLHIFLVAIVSMILFNGCDSNLDDSNTPGLQAVRNGELFKANQFSVVENSNGTYSIIGQNVLERLEFIVNDITPGTYPLNLGSSNTAVYTFNNNQQFSTNTRDSRGSVTINPGSDDGTITGSFDFVSFLQDKSDTLYMRKGIIYKIPFGSQLNTGGNTGNRVFTATVNGVLFSPIVVSPVQNGNTIVIQAARQNVQFLITVPEDITVGTYSFGTGNISGNYQTGTTVSAAISGTLVITRADRAANILIGTFNFVTGPPNNFNITNGAFDVSY